MTARADRPGPAEDELLPLPIPDGPAALLLNVRSRRIRGRAETEVAQALEAHGRRLDRVVTVNRPSRLARAVDALLGQGVGRLIVGGGDGTIGTVAARLAFRPTVLGVLPLGTANDFARTLGIPNRLRAAAEVAAGAHVRAIDLARANDDYFLNVASLGLSVLTTRLLSPRLKRWLGPTAYAVAGALAFVRHPTFRVRIDSPAGSSSSLVHQVVIGNGRYYGGGVLVAYESTLEDGTLAVYTLGARGRWTLLRTIALLRLRLPLHCPGDVFLQTPSVYIETEPRRKRVNLDGELRTTSPVRIEVVPRALRVLTPG